jgi:hypothetical protein
MSEVACTLEEQVSLATSLKTPLVFTLLHKQFHEINNATSLKQDASSPKTSLA